MSYQKPKGYILSKLIITTHENKSISILEVLDTVSIVEDIYINFLHGALTFADANDIHQLAPLIGEESITMVYKTDDVSSPEIERVFRAYRIETSDDKYKDRLSHTLYFCSIEAFQDSNTIISKSYKNKSIRFIISDAFNFLDSNKKLNIDTLSGNYHIISPNWSPMQLINYCTSIAKPKNYSGSMVLFYENSDGYNFKHLESMTTEPIIGVWSSSNAKSSTEPNNEIDPSNNIISYKILKNSVDTLKSMSEGLYSNATMAYDNISKTYKVFGYDYKKEFANTKNLADFKLNSDNFTYNNNMQRITYIPTTSFRFDSYYVKSKLGSGNVSEKKEHIIPSRTSLLSQISAKQIELEIAGDNRIVAGKTIKIEIPNVTALESIKMNKHRYNSKKVLITSVTNIFTQKSHSMILRVADDSYTESLDALPQFNEVTLNAN
jgi:hypothetical protein